MKISFFFTLIGEIIFWIVSAILICVAFTVVIVNKVLYSGLSLLFLSAGLAIIYIWIGNEFIGAIQLLLYSGAIMVLIIFMIMLLNTKLDKDNIVFNFRFLISLAISIGLFLTLLPIALNFVGTLPPTGEYNQLNRDIYGSGVLFARELYNDSLIIIEYIAILFLIGVIAAIVLTKYDYKP